jgi:hypothetical protein
MKRIWSSKFYSFLDLVQDVDSNSFKFGFGLFRVLLNHLISA